MHELLIKPSKALGITIKTLGMYVSLKISIVSKDTQLRLHDITAFDF